MGPVQEEEERGRATHSHSDDYTNRDEVKAEFPVREDRCCVRPEREKEREERERRREKEREGELPPRAMLHTGPGPQSPPFFFHLSSSPTKRTLTLSGPKNKCISWKYLTAPWPRRNFWLGERKRLEGSLSVRNVMGQVRAKGVVEECMLHDSGGVSVIK